MSPAASAELILFPKLASFRGEDLRMVNGKAQLILCSVAGQTRLKHLYQAQPLRLLFPWPDRGDVFQAAVALVSGGMVAGDRLSLSVRLEKDAKAFVIGQAAEKIYRSMGPECTIENQLFVEEGAWLEFLPQETIMFDQARLRRNTVVRLSPGAQFLGGEVVVFGRKAKGELFKDGFLHDGWEIRNDLGKLIWKDALHLEGDVQRKIESPMFDGACAYGTIIYAGDDTGTLLTYLRERPAQNSEPRIGITHFRGLLIARLIGKDALALRRAVADIWSQIRMMAKGLPPKLPRLWAI